MAERRAWFRPKTYGYGAGLPIRWEGWAVLAVYIAVVTLAALLLPAHPIAYGAAVVVATLALLAVTSGRTEGGWRWRWGGRGPSA